MTTHPPATAPTIVPRTYNAIVASLPTEGMRDDFTVEYHAAEGPRATLVLEEWASLAEAFADPSLHTYAAAARPITDDELASEKDHRLEVNQLIHALAAAELARIGSGTPAVWTIDPATGQPQEQDDPTLLARLRNALGALAAGAVVILPGGNR